MVEFRTKFHNMIVHDLRAPSTSIQQSAEVALNSINSMKRQCFKQVLQELLGDHEIKLPINSKIQIAGKN